MGTFIKKQVKKRAFKLPVAVLVCALLVIGGGIAYKAMANPDVAITTATGGEAVSIDTTSNGGTGAYTLLGGPKISEGSMGDIGLGNHVLTLPAGWEFDTSQNVTIGLESGGSAGLRLATYIIAPTATTLTFVVDNVSDSSTEALNFSEIKVRPTNQNLGSGNITATVGTIAGVVNGTTNFGTLTTVAGTPTQIKVETAADGTGTIVPAQSVMATNNIPTAYSIQRDQFNHFVSNSAVTWTMENETSGVVDGDLTAAGDNKSALFTGHFVGTGLIRATDGALTITDSGTITVTPAAPGTPTAAAGPYINAAEEAAGFNVVVPLGSSGAIVGDTLELLLGSGSFSTPLTRVLDNNDVNINGYYTFNVATGQLGVDGAKSITAEVTDVAITGTNTGPESSALALTLDTIAPPVNITYPLTTNRVNGTAVITFTDDELTNAECSIDNANWVACTTGVTTLSNITGFDALGQGAFTLYLRDTDVAGNVGTDDEVGVIKDTIAPIGTVTLGTATIYDGDLVQEVTVTYNEAMNPASTPTITFADNIGVETTTGNGAWSIGDTTWTETFTITDANEETNPATVSSSNATDVAGNTEGASVPDTFDIDTKNPTATVTISVDPMYEGSLTQTVTVTYNEEMNPGSTPTITFLTSGNWGAQVDVGWSIAVFANDTFTATFTHDGAEEEIATEVALVASASGATDVIGNPEIGDDSPGFEVDTLKPTIGSATATPDPAKDGVVTITVAFSETMNVGVSPTVTVTGLTSSPYTVNKFSYTGATWTGTFTLLDNNEDTTGTISVNSGKDTVGNTMNADVNAGTFTADTANPIGTVTLGTATIYDGDLVQEVTIDYNEAMNGASTPTITFAGATGAVTSNSDGNWTDTDTWEETFNITDANEETIGVTVDSSNATDVAGNAEGIDVTGTFDIDTLAPDAATIIIANDDVVTKDSTPILTLTGSTPDNMRFSCDNSTWSNWVAWNTTYNSFDITTGAGCSGGDGEKIVYIEVKDTAGNIQSTEDSDTIIYDSDNTLTVGGQHDFTTIQAAIDAATGGDTITVADGIYIITSAINANKAVTITGNVVNPENVLVKYNPASSTLNGVEVNSADVTVQGIKVQDCKNGFYFDRNVNTNTGVTISNCIIENVSGWGIGEISSPNTVIRDNTITSAGDKGIYFRLCEGTSESNRCEAISNMISGCGQSAIQTYFSKYAYIYDNTISSTNDKGINIIRSGATGAADRVQVIGNTISETKWPGIQVIGAPYTYVYDNTLTKCNYYGSDGTGDWDYASIHVQDDIGPTYSHYTIIDSNTVSDGINGIQTWSNDVTITNNEIYNMGATYADTKTTVDGTYKNSGILVGSMYGDDPTGTLIQYNNLHDNYWELFYKAGLVNGVTAEKNWWGSNQKTDVELIVSSNVDYDPWYLSNSLTPLSSNPLSSSDTTGPTVVLTNNIGRTIVKDADTVIITATFSDINGLDTGIIPTITISNVAITDAAMSNAGDPDVWNYPWDVPAGDTAAVVSISAKDIVGNPAQAPTGDVDYMVDNTNPIVAVTSPNGGETWAGGSNHDITWNSTEDNPGTVAIDYSIDNAVTWTSIDVSADNSDDGAFGWTVPGADTTQALVKITATDLAGNAGNDESDAVFTIDNTNPTITNVSSDKANGSYKTGEVIDIDVTFSENITSIGDVTVILETGATDQTCTFTVTDLNIGTCDYTVQAGDASPDLDVKTIAGTINDQAGNPMTDFIPATNLADNKNIVIDAIAPTLTEITPVTTPTNNTTPDYTFNSDEAGTITYGGDCSSGTTAASVGDNTVTFNALAEGVHDNCTITVTDATGNVSNALNVTAFTIDLSDPTLTTVLIASDNTNPALAKAGDIVTLSFTSDEDLTASPVVTIDGNAADAVTQGVDAQHWTATRVMQALDTEGVVVFTVNFDDLAGNSGIQITATTDASSVIYDETAPTLTEITPIPTPTNNTTPDYTFSSDEAGTIVYGGGCDSSYNPAVNGDNTITYNTLVEGTYGGCGIIVTDAAGNNSDVLNVTSFDVDLTSPVISNLIPTNGAVTSDTTPDISTDYIDVFSDINTATVVITVDGTDVTAFAAATITATDVSYTPPSSLTDGIHTVTVNVDDNAGNSAVQASWSFAVASTETTVTVTTDITTVVADNSTQAKITAHVLNNGSPASGSVDFTADIGDLTATTVALDGNGKAITYITSNDTGEATIKAFFNSDSGLKEGETNVTFTLYDGTNPVISNITSNIDPAKSGQVLNITFDVSETLGSNPAVTVDGNNAAYNSKVGLSYIYTYTVTGSETEGDVTVLVSAADTSNNTGTGSITDLTLDFTSPSFTVNDPTASGPVQTDTINITATDANDVATLKYGFSSDNTCDVSDTYGDAFVSNTNFDIAGDHADYLCAMATDNTGNTGYQLVGQLNTDNTIPTATAQYPLDNAANVAITVNPYIDFSEAMDGTTLVISKIQLREHNVSPVATVVSTLSISSNVDGSTRVTIIPGSDLDYNTKYYFWISSTVKDLAGNSFGSDWQSAQEDDHEFTTIAEDVAVTSYPISLSVGWNLISLPLIPDSTVIADVLANGNFFSTTNGNVDIVKYYNSTTETWSSYIPSSGVGDLTTMEDGKGYWMFMSSADTLTVNGTENPVYTASGETPEPVSYSVIGLKWNLIGFKSVENMDKSAYGIDSNDDLQEWNGTAIINSSTMNPGLGYWLYAQDDDEIIPPIN